VNHDDVDIREHTWKVINATVSIFVSVLLFQGLAGVSDMFCDRIIHSHLERHAAKICIAYLTFGIFYGSLHVILYNLAHMTDTTQPGKKVEASFEDVRRRKIACWTTLFAHMSGFAIIRCSLDLQQLQIFQEGVFVCVPTVMNALLLMIFFKLTDTLRGRFFAAEKNSTPHQLWEKGSQEAEDDIAAIGISFSGVVVLRFLLTGIMSNAEGLEMPVLNHPVSAKVGVGAAALLCSLCSLAVLFFHARFHDKKGSHTLLSTNPPVGNCRSYMIRWILISSSIFATAASWCALYLVKWILFGFERAANAEANPNSCIWRVVHALLVSFGSFVCVYFLDKLQDLDYTGEEADRAIGEVINAIGVLVGFSWEQAFDAAVATIGHLTRDMGEYYPIWARLGVAAAIAGVMIPAWRLYLIKKSLEKHHECKNCGYVLFAGAAFCHNCGTPKPKET